VLAWCTNSESRVGTHEGCEILPAYGSKDGGERLLCAEHKHADHVCALVEQDMPARLQTVPTFGSTEDRIALDCSDHTAPEHVDVRNMEEGCEMRPNFGLEQNDLPLWCSPRSLSRPFCSRRILRSGVCAFFISQLMSFLASECIPRGVFSESYTRSDGKNKEGS
jgi:hypothetical protein